MGNTLDSSLPQLLVESGVESDILSTHVELGELLDLLHGSGSSLLELDTEDLGLVYGGGDIGCVEGTITHTMGRVML